jgi:arylsulfatase A-like enzyme
LNYSVQRGDPESFVAGIPRIGSQTGGKAALWNDQEMSGIIAGKSCEFIEKHKAKPFFLFMATHNIHVPRAPHPRFKGTSECGVRGDTIVEFDWMVGQVLDTLDRLKLADKTLVILTSDNGGILDNNGPDIEHGIGPPESNNGHLFNGVLRGTKGSVWEGGTRLPFIARWPGSIKPGVSDALICQVDLLATFAALTGQTLAAADGPDSFNILPALLNEKPALPCREYLIEQNNNGNLVALRKGAWKLMPSVELLGRKGKAAKNESNPADKSGRPDDAPQLYNLAEDLSETKDVAAEHPEMVRALKAKLNQLRNSGRSRP